MQTRYDNKAATAHVVCRDAPQLLRINPRMPAPDIKVMCRDRWGPGRLNVRKDGRYEWIKEATT